MDNGSEIKLYKTLAEMGDAEAQAQLAKMENK
jgi:hypothetical protein